MVSEMLTVTLGKLVVSYEAVTNVDDTELMTVGSWKLITATDFWSSSEGIGMPLVASFCSLTS